MKYENNKKCRELEVSPLKTSEWRKP